MNIWGFVSFLLFSGFWAGCHRDPWEYIRRMTAEALKVQAQDSSGGKSTNINSWGWSVEECSPESWAGLALGHNKEAIKKATKNLYWIDTNHLLYGENAKEEEKKKKTNPFCKTGRTGGAPALCHPLARAVTASCPANTHLQQVLTPLLRRSAVLLKLSSYPSGVIFLSMG